MHEAATPNTKFADYALDFKRDLSHVILGRPQTNFAQYGNQDLPNLRGEATARLVTVLLQAAHRPATCILVRLACKCSMARSIWGRACRIESHECTF